MQRFAGLAMAALAASDALFCLSVLPLGLVMVTRIAVVLFENNVSKFWHEFVELLTF